MRYNELRAEVESHVAKMRAGGLEEDIIKAYLAGRQAEIEASKKSANVEMAEELEKFLNEQKLAVREFGGAKFQLEVVEGNFKVTSTRGVGGSGTRTTLPRICRLDRTGAIYANLASAARALGIKEEGVNVNDSITLDHYKIPYTRLEEAGETVRLSVGEGPINEEVEAHADLLTK